MKKKILEVEHLQKIYESHGYGVPVLKDINLTIDQGDFVAIMGPSGSGKSTLLNLISSIDQPTKGVIKLAGQDIVHMNAKALSKLRKDTIGFVFQDYSLLDSMSLLDNIVLP
ncbi:ABC transporter ATP-binding protein, partial [Dubosiella newyorkensis]